MSEENKNTSPEESQLSAKNTIHPLVSNRLLPIATSIVLALCSWFLNQAWERINKVENRVHSLEITSATNSGNKFNNDDWAEAKKILDAERNNIDRRLVRVEEAIFVLKEIVIELKDDVKAK